MLLWSYKKGLILQNVRQDVINFLLPLLAALSLKARPLNLSNEQCYAGLTDMIIIE